MSDPRSGWLRREARRALRVCGTRGRTTRVPEAARRAVMAYVAAARRENRTWRQICEDVGLSESVLRRWSAGPDVGDESVALVPVRVIADSPVGLDDARSRPKGAITVLTPSGYRVEGLGVEELATLLARIGQ